MYVNYLMRSKMDTKCRQKSIQKRGHGSEAIFNKSKGKSDLYSTYDTNAIMFLTTFIFHFKMEKRLR
jgi:hypothetical protein